MSGYLRARRVPLALAASVGAATVVWALWLVFSDERDPGGLVVVLTVVLMVSVLSTTLAAPDEDLERTAALRWPWRRAAHLLAALAVVLVVLLATAPTGARFGPAALVLRDAAGLLGLTALCATVVGAARAWFLPLGWAVVAALFPQSSAWGALATWPGQPHDSRPAAAVAAVLAVGGLLVYAVRGAARRD
ncbi:hypothetical protein O7634_02270 [Micromonospora sp. WMMD1120]|uniref:hypothetical protein n=1 Tax=Micromonospora sp. WMMD1120 TaxID=3016106 RepID=UPI002415EA8A|nr:hypothetical protein [Micromonospora sp. WMMD1120]MDG4805583.1 hypothetical protein [Micromonospora sp. WMMD1120]